MSADSKTLDQWIELYEKKTKTYFKLHPQETLVFDKRKGFMSYSVDVRNHCLFIDKVIGDGRFWQKLGYKLFAATESTGEITSIRGKTRRDLLAYHKRYTFKDLGPCKDDEEWHLIEWRPEYDTEAT